MSIGTSERTESLFDALSVIILPTGSLASLQKTLEKDLLWTLEKQNSRARADLQARVIREEGELSAWWSSNVPMGKTAAHSLVKLVCLVKLSGESINQELFLSTLVHFLNEAPARRK